MTNDIATHPVGMEDVARLKPAQFARRDRIIRTTLHLSKDRGFDKVQMRDIAAEASVALGTVYRYFPSKDLLLGSVFEAWWDGRWETLGGPVSSSTNAGRLIEISTRAVEAYEKEPQVLQLSTTLATSPDPLVRACLDRVHQRAHDLYVQHLDGLAGDEAEAIVDILLAVITAKLALWQAGRLAIDRVYAEIARCVRVLLEFRDPKTVEH